MKQTIELGRTLMSALVFTVSEHLEDYNAAAEALGAYGLPDDGRPSELLYSALEHPANVSRVRSLPADKLRAYMLAMCTVHHELQHVRQASSSPIGMMLALGTSEILVQLHKQLHGLSRNGCRQLHVPLLAIPASAESGIDRKLRDLAGHLEAQERLLRTFTGNRQVPISTTIAERQQLRTIDNRHPEYQSNLNGHAPSSPAGLTLTHLLEAECRLEDVKMINLWIRAGASSSVAESVLEALMRAPGYHEAWDYFRKEATGCPLICFPIAIYLALWPDGLVGVKRPDCLRWEDTQPCWRFCRIIDWLKVRSIPEQSNELFTVLIEEICESLGWASPTAISERYRDVDTKRMENALERDLFERHLLTAEALRQWGPDLFGGYSSLSYYSRLRPWIRGDGKRILLQEVPSWLPDREAINIAQYSVMLIEVIYTGNLTRARRFLDMVLHDELVSGSVATATADSHFAEGVQFVTGFDLSQLAFLRPMDTRAR